jgi:hypothetical protein
MPLRSESGAGDVLSMRTSGVREWLAVGCLVLVSSAIACGEASALGSDLTTEIVLRVNQEKVDARDKEEGATHYAPKVGDVRVYEVKQGDAVISETTEVVTKVEAGSGWLRVSGTAKTNGKPGERAVFGPMLKLPVKVGDSWTKESDPIEGRSLKTTSKVVKVEDVATPAGTFKALRVETTLTTREGFSTDSVLWFAPGVGVVKTETHSGKFVKTKVLKSVTSK